MALRHNVFDDENFAEFRSHHIQVRTANSPWEKRRYFALRQQVFGSEQKLFTASDQDAHDFRSIPIIAVASSCGVHDDVVGAVRIYPMTTDSNTGVVAEKNLGENTWFGGRLCVARTYRGFQAIGKALINEAVTSAKELGCTRFFANVQTQNQTYFENLHWRPIAPIIIEGKAHVRMQADLNAYPFMPRSKL